nr:MAG TPA: hypothetical protein [Caudoviricetes sp.]
MLRKVVTLTNYDAKLRQNVVFTKYKYDFMLYISIY